MHGSDGTDLHKSNEEPADPLGILDLFVVAAEIWPLLVLGPLLAGVITYFVSPARAPDYVASSAFSINAAVPGPVLQSMLSGDLEETPSGDISVDVTPQAATITTHATTSEQARGSISAALSALALHPVLSIANAAAVTASIKQNQDRISSFQSLFDQLEPTVATAISSQAEGQSNDRGDALAAFIILSDKLAELTSANDELQRSLDSKLIDSPDQKIYVNKVQTARLTPVVLSVLLVGLVIYVGALLRHLWRQASVNPRTKPKIDRIRSSLHLFRSR